MLAYPWYALGRRNGFLTESKSRNALFAGKQLREKVVSQNQLPVSMRTCGGMFRSYVAVFSLILNHRLPKSLREPNANSKALILWEYRVEKKFEKELRI